MFYTPHALTSRDRWDLLWLGVVGHCLYQLFFAGGLARTSASNAALIFGASPVAVAIMTAAIGHERVGRLHWLGAVLSTAGIYFVVGHGAATGGGTLFGDLLMLVRGRLLVDLHDRRRPAHVAPLAAVRHWHDDGDRDRAVCAAGNSDSS